jgi:hypothetical protein
MHAASVSQPWILLCKWFASATLKPLTFLAISLFFVNDHFLC